MSQDFYPHCHSSVLVNDRYSLRASTGGESEDNASPVFYKGAIVFDGKAVQKIALTVGNYG